MHHHINTTRAHHLSAFKLSILVAGITPLIVCLGCGKGSNGEPTSVLSQRAETVGSPAADYAGFAVGFGKVENIKTDRDKPWLFPVANLPVGSVEWTGRLKKVNVMRNGSAFLEIDFGRNLPLPWELRIVAAPEALISWKSVPIGREVSFSAEPPDESSLVFAWRQIRSDGKGGRVHEFVSGEMPLTRTPDGFEMDTEIPVLPVGDIRYTLTNARPVRFDSTPQPESSKEWIRHLESRRKDAVERLPDGTIVGVRCSGDIADDVSLLQLRGLPDVATLIIQSDGVNFVTDAGMAHLAHLKTLRVLSLQGTRISGKGLDGLTALSALESLSLPGNPQLGDDAVEFLSQLKSLRSLDLTDTSMTRSGIEAVQQALPGCRIQSTLSERGQRWLMSLSGPTGAEFLGALLSHDGRSLLTHDAQSNATLWDTASMTPRKTIASVAPEHGNRYLNSLSFSPRGTWLLQRDGEQVAATDALTGESVFRLDVGSGSVALLAASADESRLAVYSDPPRLTLWDLKSKDRLATFDYQIPPLSAMAWLPDERTVVVGRQDGGIEFVSAETLVWKPQPISNHRPSPPTVKRIEAIPRMRAIAATNVNGLTSVWHTDRRRFLGNVPFPPLTNLSNATARYQTPHIDSADGEFFATWTPDGRVNLRSTVDGRLLDTLIAGPECQQVSLSTEGTRLLSVAGNSKRSVHVFNLERIAATGNELLDASDNKSESTVKQLIGHTGPVGTVRFSPDGKTIASAANALDSQISLWDVTTGMERAVLDDAPEELGIASVTERNRPGVRLLDISPDGKLLASAGEDGLIRIWNLASGRLERRLEGHTGSVISVGFHPTKPDTLISSGIDQQLRVWDTSTGTMTESVVGACRTLMVAPNGRYMAKLGARDGPLTFARVDGFLPTEVQVLPAGRDMMYLCADFSADGRLFAYGTSHGVMISALTEFVPKKSSSKRPVKSARSRPAPSVAPSPMLNFPVFLPRQPLRAELAICTALAFAPDGQSIAAAYVDGEIGFWRILWAETPEKPGSPPTFQAHLHSFIESGTPEIRTLAFAPDGRSIAVTAQDSIIRIYPTPDVANKEMP